MKASEFRKLIREEVRKTLTEAQTPSFQAKHKDNNLVAAIYFSYNKAENNNASLWTEVIKVLEQNKCKLINYVVTDSVCEFEFQPGNATGKGTMSQDNLKDTRDKVIDTLKSMASKFTGYDVYIVGN